MSQSIVSTTIGNTVTLEGEQAGLKSATFSVTGGSATANAINVLAQAVGGNVTWGSVLPGRRAMIPCS